MPKRPRGILRPTEHSQAAQFLRQPEAAPLMLGPRVPEAYLEGAAVAVDLSGLNLNYVKQESDLIVHVGAMAPLQDVADSALLQAQAGGLLAQAAHLSAGSAMRHLATLGGAVAAPKGPPEVALALLVLDATVVVQSDGDRREIALADYTTGPDLVVELKFAPPAGRGALERVARTPKDEAIVACAVVIRVEEGVCRHVRLAVGGAGPRPSLVRSVEKILSGQKLTPELIAEAADAVEAVVNPTNDFRCSSDYRRDMARILARRALTAAWQPA